jgi:thiamine transport system ATP-binding protein
VKTALEMRGVERTLGGTTMRFDFSRARGSVTAILGPSGSGKSTLLNLVAGFLVPDRGEVFIDGETVGDVPPGERGVSMVFQDNNLFAHLDIATNIGLGLDPALRLDAARRDRIAGALERVGLAGFEKRLPGTLSGGERQRVALARAFARARPLLLLDEPFDGLGPGLAADMLALMLEIRADVDATVLMVTHDPHEAASAADHVLFVDHGTIAADTTMDGFFERDDLPALSAYLRGRTGP